jgi:rhodanese-related sulfurtransferase
MKKFFSNLTLNQRLIVIALTLGFLALLIGSPYSTKASVDVKELSLIISRGEDHITVEALAETIMKGTSDYTVVDIRTKKEYEEYHIPTATNIPLAELVDTKLAKDEKIALYSEGGIHSSQAWYLMKARGYLNVYFLTGGLDEWKENILFPSLPANATPEQTALFEKRKGLCAYFGGTPQTGGTGTKSTPKMAMPKLTMPSAPAGAPVGGKKKKEGC